MTEIKLTFFKGPAQAKDQAGTTKAVKFDTLALWMSSPRKGPKNGSYFLRGVCQGTRSNEHMTSAWLAIVDADQGIDGPCPPVDVTADALRRIDYEFCLYTSFSHTTEAPRYRILFPLAQAITRQDTVKRLYVHLLDLLKEEGIELRATQESGVYSQPWFPPRYQTEAQREAFRFAQGGFFTLVPGEVLPKVKKTAQGRYGKPPVDVAACIEAIRSGADVHNSMNSIIAHLAAHGVHKDVIEALLEQVLLNNAPTEKVEARIKEIPRSIKGAVFKFTPKFCEKGTPENGNKPPKIKILN